jgi:hypothetical protein
MVRIQFLAASPSQVDGKTVSVYEPQFSIALTPQAFAQMFSKMELLANSMVEAGVLFKRGEERREGPARNTDPLPVEGEDLKTETAATHP